jgi:SNF2 family DNA or RNA helicase
VKTRSRSSAVPWKPHKFQGKAVQRLLDNPVQMLLASPGAGKTSITLDAFRRLQDRGVARRALVIPPLRPAYLVWPAEVDKWQQFEHLAYTVLHGPDKEDRLEDDVDLFIMNWEGLDWLLDAQTFETRTGRKGVELDLKRLKALECDTLVYDELTKTKNHQSLRFQMLKQIIPLFARRWGLTGSPAANGLMGLFGQTYAVDEGRTFGPYITQFRSKYFVQHPALKFRWDIKTEAKHGLDGEKAIFDALKPIALRIDAADHIQTPVGVPLRVDVALPPKVRDIYDAMEEDLFALIATGKRDLVLPSTAANSGVALGKCRQIASGALYLEPGQTLKGFKSVLGSRQYVELHQEKLDALEERLDELQGQPYLLGYEYQHTLDRLLKRFGKKVTVFGGSGDMKAEKRIEDAWNAGDIELLVGHPQSIGHGLNLQGASQNVGYLDPIWDYELYDQFIRRVLRQGNRHAYVYVDHYVALDTVDETIFRVSALGGSKAKQQDRFFDALMGRKREKQK